MPLLNRLCKKLFKNSGANKQEKQDGRRDDVHTYSKPHYNAQLTSQSRAALRPKTADEKELEERVWKAQLQHRAKVLKERFAAQQIWMAKYEKEAAERKARKETAQKM